MNRSISTALSLLSVSAVLACNPTLDDPVSEGGLAPDPVATLRGTLTYSGLPPTCDADGNVQGLALLSLFSTANPPPPNGSGLPASLLLVRGDRLFRAPGDCRRAQDTRSITRSVDFTWPGVPLDSPRGGAASYTITGTWDDDRNLNPLFTARASPTLGDTLGGAFEGDLSAPSQSILRVGPSIEHPNGQVLNGVAVTLLAPVVTELPVSRLTGDTADLDSAATLPPAFDRAGLEAGLRMQTEVGLELVDLQSTEYAATMEAAGLDLSSDPVARAWYVRPLDIDGNGETDPHPILGPLVGAPRLSPVVVLLRARTPAEVAAGVPNVLLLGHPLSARPVQPKTVDLAVPPVAVVQLDPLDPACAVPYAAPGNLTLAYEAAGAVCTELPTGAYDVNVLHGFAGATPVPTSTQASPSGFDLAGGQFSGQFWIVPNELGPPDTRYDPAAVNQLDPPDASESRVRPEQGPAGRFFVTDADPNDDPGSARPGCQQALDPVQGIMRPIRFAPVSGNCCARVAHLCGLPLCPAQAAEDGAAEGSGMVRQMQALGEDGKATCVPFEMPPSCCS